MKLPNGARRLAIFAYYDSDGCVDAYVPYLLNAVRQFCTRQVVVVNGKLRAEARAALEACADELVQRSNQGFDVTAYKEAFLSVADLSGYDEILFYNQTIFGPVCPLEDMFRVMDARDVDFWGLTRHKGAKRASWGDHRPVLPHVQSFFFAVRSSLFRKPEFTEYWRSLPPVESYWDAVGKHEVVFTNHFEQLGYTWDVYVKTRDLEEYNDYPLMGMPVVLLRERGCPFCKRKSFVTPRQSYITMPQGLAMRQLYEYLRDETEYPTSLIAENLTRTVPLPDSVKALGLIHDVSCGQAGKADVLAVLNVTNPALAPVLAQAAAGFSPGTAVMVLCAGDRLRAQMAEAMPDGLQVEFHVIDGRGPQALLGELWPKVAAHRYLLYLSDDLPPLLGEFADSTSLLAATEVLRPEPCAAVLEKDENFGVLIPLMPSHQESLSLGMNLQWESEKIQTALPMAGRAFPLGKSSGIASRGGMFFARTQALAPLAGAPLEADLFEGLYPVWEYLPMLAAQACGKLTAFMATPEKAFNEWLNKTVMLDEIEQLWATPRKMRYDQIQFRMNGILDFYYERRYHMTLQQAFNAPLTFKQKVWICLQIWLKPSTFQALHRLLRRKPQPPPKLPKDELD